MRIGVISDLHIDNRKNPERLYASYLEHLSKLAEQHLLDCLAIAGDISNDSQLTLQFITDLEDHLPCPVRFVAGNHDLWTISEEEKNTQQIAGQLQADLHSLQNRPYILNDEWAMIGHSGWYDYSFGHHFTTHEQFKQKQYNGRTWKDHLYIDWKMTDDEVVEQSLIQLQSDLERIGNRQVILCLHMVATDAFIVPTPHPVFDYFNAFLGSKRYAEWIESHPSIRYIINGHVHYRKKFAKNGQTYICACLGNESEWQTSSLEKELQSAFQVIDLGNGRLL
ncbi:metallophosphoesterase [Sporosarcina koreensis]|uniref:metallophosphoesterase n=1 Tax=Bacillales TaxID=1385 RepID=UPI00075BE779|nr:metallophosphoesterase [Sporosarcina koreensis]